MTADINRNCESCCYWSDKLAMAEHGQVKAMCLAPAELREYRVSRYTCRSYTEGEPIDLGC